MYALYYVHWELTIGASRRAMIKQHGCKPMKNSRDLNSFPNNIIGIKEVKDSVKAANEHRLLEYNRSRFLNNGNNTHSKIFFTDLMQTLEPENLKTMMALDFKKWGLGQRRKDAFVPLLGHGIFTTDGAAWHNSRELLRPNFVRSQVGDLATFEIHVNQLIKAIPKDGSTVDLQELFFMLTMDSATEFLFGESTNCLAPNPSPDNFEFAQAFTRSQEAIAASFRTGMLEQWRLESTTKKDRMYCQDFVDKFVQRGLEYRKRLEAGKSDDKADDRYVFLYELVQRTTDPLQLRAELMNVLLAGRDTTASLLSDTWFVLARRPDIWTKLAEEVDALGGEKPTVEQIRDMKYLRWVFNECKHHLGSLAFALAETWRSITPLPSSPGQHPLRRSRHRLAPRRRRRRPIPTLHPQRPSGAMVPLLHAPPKGLFRRRRRRIQAGEMGDVETRVGVSALQRRSPDLHRPYENPILPRQLEEKKLILKKLEQFALMEASYTTIRLMQEFKQIESRDDRPWTEWLTLTCAIQQGTLVGLTPA